MEVSKLVVRMSELASKVKVNALGLEEGRLRVVVVIQPIEWVCELILKKEKQ